MSAAAFGRSAATYLAMVGVPVAGLVWVLRAGGSIEAPPVLGGAWETGDLGAEVVSCFGIEDGGRWSIEQSGRYLRVHAEGATADARFEDERVRLEIAAPGGSCEGRALALSGALDDAGAVHWDVRATECGACPSARFTTRRPTE